MFVKCSCEQCSGHIEFDEGYAGLPIVCPHCGSETKLFIPSGLLPPPKIKPEASQTDTSAELRPTSSPAQTDNAPEGLQSAQPPAAAAPVTNNHKRVRFVKDTKVALTPAQCATPTGKELIDLLCDVVRNGLVSEAGVRRLNDWLAGRADTDIPAIKFLLQISDRILRTGKVTTAKAFEMQFAIERVLPKNIRGGVKEKRQETWLHSPLKPKATQAQFEYIRGLGGTPPPGLNISEASLLIEQLLENSAPLSQQLATEKQLQFIRDLGGHPAAGLTKEDAAALIPQLEAKQRELFAKQQSPTPRQIMVLRFWNRMDLAQLSKWDVENWLSQFYDENPRRKAAWEIFKNETGDDGSQHDPSCVPLGASESYMTKLTETLEPGESDSGKTK